MLITMACAPRHNTHTHGRGWRQWVIRLFSASRMPHVEIPECDERCRQPEVPKVETDPEEKERYRAALQSLDAKVRLLRREDLGQRG